jgi:hypothetical protein
MSHNDQRWIDFSTDPGIMSHLITYRCPKPALASTATNI